MADSTSVKVALRVRPLVPREISASCKDLLEVFPNLGQVRIKSLDKSFTYNYAFGPETEQGHFYNKCVQPLIKNLFEGYNVTILAYGQTGSGKTHSMGTAYSGEEDMGIIPRAVTDIYEHIRENFCYDFNVSVSFMELYQEVLYDLFSAKPREQSVVDIREDHTKGIFIPGLTEQHVTSAAEMLNLLAKGSQGRATGCTNMNSQSSRSHAIFTINISIIKKDSGEICKQAKFNLVDLAGSERSKKTGATGQTFKEGININKGLLALGNVISALGDEKNPNAFVSFRDSNLTRLLKDSLGGNSITLMIACVSPADYNVEETLSTLRYADRAKKIKNKPIVNEDPKAGEINRLKKIIQQLQLQIVEQGPQVYACEYDSLKKEMLELKSKCYSLNVNLFSSLTQNSILQERALLIQTANESLLEKLNTFKDKYNVTLQKLSECLDKNDISQIREHLLTLQEYETQIIELKNEHRLKENEIKKHEVEAARNSMTLDAASESEICERQELQAAKQFELNTELHTLTKELAIKEHLAEQIASNMVYMVNPAELAECEAKIETLQKEKEDLTRQLKTVTTQGGNSKIAEQRAKRVQELETQIQALNKKVIEQAKLIKMKEKSEIKIKQLNSEIQSMKAAKVKLIKNMRQESENFRTWKIQRQKELSKLQTQDRKRKNEMNKMEAQQVVLKRKVEEAAAVNKRLKDALALRRKVQESKNSGKLERLEPWIKQEFNLFVSTIDAKTSLTALLEHRAAVQAEIDKLNLDREANIAEIVELEKDIEIRSLQIQDLQQKIIDSDEEQNITTRFDNIQTMSEAKFIIKTMFELTADLARSDVEKRNEVSDLQNSVSELQNEVKNLNEKIKLMEKQHFTERETFDREYEEKVAILLKQIAGVKDGEDWTAQVTQIQQETIEKLEFSNRMFQKEIEDLKNQLTEMKEQSVVVKKPKRQKNSSDYKKNQLSVRVPFFDSSFEDNNIDDPDWQWTPLAKRVHAIRGDTSTTDFTIPGKKGKGSCSCKGRCNTRICGCKKFDTYCSDLCKCPSSLCTNKENKIKEENLPEENLDATRIIEAIKQEDGSPPLKRTRLLFNES